MQSSRDELSWTFSQLLDLAPILACTVVSEMMSRVTESSAGVANIELEVYLRQGSLIGAATTQGPVQLPFWVALKPTV